MDLFREHLRLVLSHMSQPIDPLTLIEFVSVCHVCMNCIRYNSLEDKGPRTEDALGGPEWNNSIQEIQK